ncbi:MAG: DUF885 domain-containing protein [Candidatus Dormibacteria bacterium]
MAEPQLPGDGGADLEAVLAAVVADQFQAHPALGRANGDHSLDGRVASAGAAARAARVATLSELRARLGSLPPPRSRDARLDWDWAGCLLEAELFDLQVRQRWLHDPTVLLESDSPLEVGGYLLRDYAPLPDRVGALCQQLQQSQDWIEASLADLAPELPRPLVELARQGLAGHRHFLEAEVRPVGGELSDPQLRRRLEEAVAAGQAALERIAAELEARSTHAQASAGLGAEPLLAMLRAQEGIDLSLAQLREQADQELDRLTERRDQVLSDRFRGEDLGSARRRMEADHFQGDNLIANTAGMLAHLRQFVEERAQVPVPEGPPCRVRDTPGFMSAWVSAAYDSVGPLESRPLPCLYYVTTPQPGWSQREVDEWLRYLNRAALTNVSVHEVYPGHHVHTLHVLRQRADIRRFFWSSGFGEGWAHYTEQLMVEAGLAESDPLLELAQLEDALVRACRYRNTLGLHAEGWSVEDGTRLFMDRAGIDELPARRESSRGTFDPLYLVYTLGKLRILHWRERWLTEGRGDLRQFHQRVLGAGSPPLGALERWLATD